jgi:hypothetical protein
MDELIEMFRKDAAMTAAGKNYWLFTNRHLMYLSPPGRRCRLPQREASLVPHEVERVRTIEEIDRLPNAQLGLPRYRRRQHLAATFASIPGVANASSLLSDRRLSPAIP